MKKPTPSGMDLLKTVLDDAEKIAAHNDNTRTEKSAPCTNAPLPHYARSGMVRAGSLVPGILAQMVCLLENEEGERHE